MATSEPATTATTATATPTQAVAPPKPPTSSTPTTTTTSAAVTASAPAATATAASSDQPTAPRVEIEHIYPLHFAVWDNDTELLQTRLASKQYDIERLDPAGNTPLLLAYFLNRTEAAKLLLAAGAMAKARTKQLNEAIEVACLSANPHLVRIAAVAMLRETDAAWVRRLPKLLPRLEAMKDFYMEINWVFRSWVPLVSKLRIWKTGSNIRMDCTLLGFEGLSWKRGNLSFVLTGSNHPTAPGDLLILDRELKTAASFRRNMLRPRDKDQQNWVRVKLTNKIKLTNFWSTGVTFKRCNEKGWLWGESTTPKKAVVGDWKECSVFQMDNMKVDTLFHPKILSKLDAAAWWRPEYSFYEGTAAEEAWWRADNALFKGKDKSDAGAGAGAGATKSGDKAATDSQPAAAEAATTATAAAPAGGAGGGAGASDGAAATTASTSAKPPVADFYSIHEDDTQEVIGAEDAPDPEAFLKLKNIAKTVRNMKDDGAPQVVEKPATTTAASSAEKLGAGACTHNVGFAEYFGADTMATLGKVATSSAAGTATDDERAAAAAVHKPTVAMGWFDRRRMKEQKKTFNKVALVMSKEFPFSTDDMLPIAEVMSRTARHWRNVERFFTKKFPKGEGFPVQFTVPVAPTVVAEVSFARCRLMSAPASMYQVPRHFKVGAFADRSIFSQV